MQLVENNQLICKQQSLERVCSDSLAFVFFFLWQDIFVVWGYDSLIRVTFYSMRGRIADSESCNWKRNGKN